jgi:hypothetical protein
MIRFYDRSKESRTYDSLYATCHADDGNGICSFYPNDRLEAVYEVLNRCSRLISNYTKWHDMIGGRLKGQSTCFARSQRNCTNKIVKINKKNTKMTQYLNLK